MKFISTAGHGYLQITPNQLRKAMRKGFKPTSFSFFSKSQVLLEEDCDLSGFMVAMYGDDRQAKFKEIKSVYQNDINRSKYLSTPETEAEFDAMLEILTPQIKHIGMTMITTNGERYKIVGRQKNGYHYNDGQTWNMPFNRIAQIVETV